MWYIIIGIIVVLVLFSGKKKTDSNSEHEDLGMYFMDIYQDLKKNKENSNEFTDSIAEFYCLLGCASQVRIDEIKEMQRDSKDEDPILYGLIQDFKPQIDKMAKVSKRIEDAPIGYDMKDGESIGEYESKKLKKSKVFMTEFTFFKNLDLQNYLKQKHAK